MEESNMGRRAGMDIRLCAVIYKRGDTWYGQCLEHDIAARAKTPQSLPFELERAIVAHLKIADENHLHGLAAIPEAPQVYREMFDRGLKVERPEQHTLQVAGLRFQSVTELRLSE